MESIQHFFRNVSAALGLRPETFGNLLAALLLLLVGYLVAKFIGNLVHKLVARSGLQERIDRSPSSSRVNVGRLIGKLVYYLLMLFVLIGVLDLLGFDRALGPLERMFDGFAGFLPRLLAALALGFAGYIIATIASELVALAVSGVEGLAQRFGLDEGVDWARVARQVVFFVVFIPILIAAIDALGIDAIARPATNILQDMLDAVPKVLGAALILILFYYIARFVSRFVSNLLAGVQVDQFASRIGLGRLLGSTQLSSVASGLVFFLIVLSGIVTAIEVLDFEQLGTLVEEIFEITLQIIFGLLILVVGNAIAKFAHDAVLRSQSSSFLASLARYVVLALFIAIALRTMGIADDIVNLAFGLTLGALAVAFALSFGLGGREAAGKQMEDFFSKLRRESKSPSNTSSKLPPPPAPPTA